MFKFIICVIVLVILLFVLSFKLSDVKAKRDFVSHLHEFHYDKYEILTFKRNFNTANMNPHLYRVELELKENINIVITFEWDAKNKDVHFPYHTNNDRGIESLTRYQQQAIILEKELHELLQDDVLSIDIDVFNHTLELGLEAEPTLQDFQYFSNKICGLLKQYPDTWNLDGHINFSVNDENKGFYELILKPNTNDDNDHSFNYKHNAILVNNYGSAKAAHIVQVVEKEFSKPESPVYLSHIWVHQKCLNTFFIAFEKHEPRKDPFENNQLTEGVGMGLVKMTYPDLALDTYKYYDYKTISEENTYLYLIKQLPEEYQYLEVES
ncbi:hypothetical protein [uncultured Maribacter sp.]|uniref:hypothetical protein n=1 Tax=uncultured Maribacter sp. TaxID=431308 RepID=UPI00260CED05|nr:hypothetical protein [uncultured Maribacter sp.]